MKTIFAFLLICLLVTVVTAQNYKPGDHELFIMPTAYTMEAGQSYFTDYELFFLNYTFAATNTTHIGVFTLFPITSNFLETITLGAKQQFLTEGFVKGALWGSYIIDASLVSLGTVFSIGDNPSGLHLGISAANSLDRDVDSDQWELIYMAGYRHDVSESVGLIVEYTNFSTAVEEEFKGILMFGIRFKGDNLSWDIAGIRLLEDTGDLFLLPLLKATFFID